MSQKQTFPHYFTLKVTSSEPSHVPDGTEPTDQIRYILVYNASSGTSLEGRSLTIQTRSHLSPWDGPLTPP